MKALSIANVSVKKSPVHGWGVFANEDIPAHGLIEQCHVLVIPKDNGLRNYTFSINDDKTVEDCGLPLGYGAIYNHSDNPNARYYYDAATNTMNFFARSFIKSGEEIFVYYGKDWFSSRDTVPIQASHWFRVRKMMKMVRRMSLVTAAVFMTIKLLHELLM